MQMKFLNMQNLVVGHLWQKYGKFAKFCPFLMSYWSLEYIAQIAGNGISGVLILKISRGEHAPRPHLESLAHWALEA
jgi:hypothetical protein